LLCPALWLAACGCTRRRLELFGEDHNIRDGWVTVGKAISRTNFKPTVR
jgi:N6-adenosine-specific RNA methylase IME4